MKEKEFSRRSFLHQLVAGTAAVTGAGILLSGCQGDKSGETKSDNSNAAAPADPCNDFSGVSAGELEKRKKFGYVDKSSVSGNSCSNCGLFIPWEKEKNCGGCLLFKGPVHTEGYCVQWAAKAGAS